MRFLYYDRVTKIEKGKRIEGVKSFSLSEEFLKGHFKKKALVPGVIFIEAMAQILGWLVIYSHDFQMSPIMSLIEGVKTTSTLRPGFTAELRGEIVSTSKRDTLGRAETLVDGQVVASIDRIIYSHIAKVDPEEFKSRFSYYSGIELGEDNE
jgi:3-hydroxyacyl-[acyl-carrier-protein] dehydratase